MPRHELERRLAQHAAQLQAANEEMEDFAHAITLELRAPLRQVEGFLRMLRATCGDPTRADTQHWIGAISLAVRRMAALIDDLLSLSHLGRAQVVLSEVDLGQLVHEVVDDLLPEVEGRSIDWRIGPLPVVTADRAMVRVAVAHLLSNALKFTRPRARAEIEVHHRREGDEDLVTVRDNGVGFDMAYADKLFGAFQRLHPSVQFEGTGIGLACVKRVIRRHGGRVWAEARVNAGATFGFTLPADSRPAQPCPEVAARAPCSRVGR